MKKLPIGINDYKQIIEGNYIYVDKTRYLHEMATTGIYYFLSRPRRFGKSLTVSTFYYLFTGEKELFKDTWIYNNWDWEKERYPVVVLDMNRLNTSDIGSMRKRLEMILEEHAEIYGIVLQDDTIDGKFEQLIKKAHEKVKKPVVLLIDEYEKPILDHITNKAKIEEMRNELRQFYGKIKSLGSSLRFVFITGITKFTKMGVFSALNNLTDITFSEFYSQMLGYTQQEIEHYFSEHITKVSREMKMTEKEYLGTLKSYYDGFSFDGLHHVYNPYAVLLALYNKKFASYWNESGAPQFIFEYFKTHKVTRDDLVGKIVPESDFTDKEIEDTSPVIFLTQAGYLTLTKRVSPDPKQGPMYILGIPNIDVEAGLDKVLLEARYGMDTSEINQKIYIIRESMAKEDVEQLMGAIQSALAEISYDVIERIKRSGKEDKITQLESFYQTYIKTLLGVAGYKVIEEQIANTGRADLVVKTNGTVYIFELKIDQPASKAIEQIKQKRYYESYRYKRCYLVGISISSEERNIKEWKYEKV
ncbi:ATP-binding protein [Thermotoga profunda]|uniref:ATP-binding protein n=1 Tax=Thermotoga profunda TaxID=1508420 RepID=UPI000596E667|nr:ATP-binding protein [Thermotoga profunda]